MPCNGCHCSDKNNPKGKSLNSGKIPIASILKKVDKTARQCKADIDGEDRQRFLASTNHESKPGEKIKLHTLIAALALIALPLASFSADRPVESIPKTGEVRQGKQFVIKTKQDLFTQINSTDVDNAFNKLSDAAKWRLFDTATTNADGAITSFMTADIANELSPAEAYAIFASLGVEELAAHHHNGKFLTRADYRAVKLAKAALEKKPHPASDGYYCNGGYCTANKKMTCPSSCSPQ